MKAGRTFEQWIAGIFDHPVTDPAWYSADDADLCLEPDERNVEYLTRLFSESGPVLRRFDNAQVNQGLNLIASSPCSDHVFTLTSGKVPWPKRQACIRSIFELYAHCFTERCTPALSHREEIANPLNYICYMWWDVFPAYPNKNCPTDVQDTPEYLAVMERCLTLPNDACLESALHGLGHWQLVVPDQVEPIIDRFVHRRPDLHPDLMQYVRRAPIGAVQ